MLLASVAFPAWIFPWLLVNKVMTEWLCLALVLCYMVPESIGLQKWRVLEFHCYKSGICERWFQERYDRRLSESLCAVLYHTIFVQSDIHTHKSSSPMKVVDEERIMPSYWLWVRAWRLLVGWQEGHLAREKPCAKSSTYYHKGFSLEQAEKETRGRTGWPGSFGQLPFKWT